MNLEVMKAPGGIRANEGHSYQSIERAAIGVRRLIASNVPVDQALPCLVLFEQLHKYAVHVGGRQTKLEQAVEPLPRGVEGSTRYDAMRNKIVIGLSQQTYDLLEQDNRRARFSFAHEVGHGTLHYRELMRMGTIAHQMAALYRGEALRHRKARDTEWQANAFGAALLMPAAGLASLERQMDPFPLDWPVVATVFKVSRLAAMYRLETFNKKREELLNP